MEDKLICVAKCNKPHGIRGEIKVTVLMDNPEKIRKLSELKGENEVNFHKIERVFAVSDCFGIKLSGVDTVQEANFYKGKNLYAKREEVDALLEKGRIFVDDLLNKVAVLDNGEKLGVIEDVDNYGANDIVFIKSTKYKNLSFANIGGIIEKIDYEENLVYLNKSEFEKVCVYDD